MIRAALNDGCDAKAAFAALTTVGDFDAFGQDNIENGLTRIHDNRPARLRDLTSTDKSVDCGAAQRRLRCALLPVDIQGARQRQWRLQ